MFLARTKIPAYGFFSNLMAGILPFGAVFIELFFILSVSRLSVLILMSLLMRSTLLLTLFVLQFFQAIWENQFYYLFGFLFLVFIILAMCCSLIAVVVIYFQLCAEVSILYVFQDYPTIGCKKLLVSFSKIVFKKIFTFHNDHKLNFLKIIFSYSHPIRIQSWFSIIIFKIYKVFKVYSSIFKILAKR